MRSMATATSTKPGAVELRRDLGLADLTLTQVLFIVGLPWVGVAAKQGPAHVLFWLAAIALFYLPSAAVVIHLNRAMPLEGGLYQWAKLGFNELTGFLVARTGMPSFVVTLALHLAAGDSDFLPAFYLPWLLYFLHLAFQTGRLRPALAAAAILAVTIYSGVRIGNRVTVHAGARIGSDGFGYVPRDGQHLKIPHVGGCVIEDDVEIGANTTIDRGSIDDTVVGAGTKIDNLVQIAHNVRIGKACLIMAQVGIAGSVRVEDGCMLLGQVGVSGHHTIGQGARLAAQAGVFGDIPAGETWSGYPARPHKEALRAQAALFKLPNLLRRIERLLNSTPPETK